MSNQLTIHTGAPVLGTGDGNGPSHSAVATKAPAVKPVPLFVNPSFQFDSTVGLVVIEFHDAQGTVNNSIPSQRQLDAYRSHRALPPGEEPPPADNPPHPPRGATSAG
jgi:hypothetical protein